MEGMVTNALSLLNDRFSKTWRSLIEVGFAGEIGVGNNIGLCWVPRGPLLSLEGAGNFLVQSSLNASDQLEALCHYVKCLDRLRMSHEPN